MPGKEKLIVEHDKLRQMLETIIDAVCRDRQKCSRKFAVIGIRDKGAMLGKIVADKLSQRLGREIPLGILDIGLYRDDVGTEPWQPKVKATEIDFNIDGLDILLVDDVLQSGRTTRAAIGVLFDLGRPSRIQLAVLIDRGGRELPFAADYVGRAMKNVKPNERIRVEFQDSVDVENVFLETKE